jgi:hypothetical protein
MYGTVALPEWTILEARDRYLAENGFTLAGYLAPYVEVKVLGRVVRIKNRPSRQRVVPLHDLHHVATGYGTDLAGEGEIAAWELRAGCNEPVLFYLNGMAFLMGLCVAPRRVLTALRRASGQRTLYVTPGAAGDLSLRTVGELRSALGVPLGGATNAAPRLHPDAPGLPGEPAHRVV